MSRRASLDQIAAARGILPRTTIEAAVRAFLATYATKNWAARAALLSKDVVFEDTVGVPPHAVGREAAAAYFRLVIDAGWNVETVPERIVVMGDEAFVLTHGEWGVAGDPPARLHLFHNFRFGADGAIAHVRVAYEQGCLLD